MLSKRPLKPVDLVFIACMVTLTAVALYTVPTSRNNSVQEVLNDGRSSNA